jgi:prepilin-type N-terminal cleavage/methylation domain-containing protein
MQELRSHSKQHAKGLSDNKGFTLIELLVVLAILSLLIGLLLPAVQSAREAARRSQCSNNMRQIGIALHTYHDSFNSFPFGQSILGSGDSLWIKILPFLEQQSLYNSFNQQNTIYDRANRTVQAISLAVYQCPSDSGSGVRSANKELFIRNGYADNQETILASFTSYVASFGTTDTTATIYPDQRGFAIPDGLISNLAPISMTSVTDGLSQTMLASERATAWLQRFSTIASDIPSTFGWYFRGALGDTMFTSFYPPNMPIKVGQGAGINHAFAASSLHPGGIEVLMGDGSLRFVKDSISTWPFDSISGRPSGASAGPGGHWSRLPTPGIWQAITTRSGGEIISSDAF